MDERLIIYGLKASDETRAKMSLARMGRTGPSLDGRLRDLSGRLVADGGSTLVKPESGFKGHKHSAESRAKVSKSKLGKSINRSGPGSFTGRKHTDEAKAKISLAKIGNTHARKCA